MKLDFFSPPRLPADERARQAAVDAAGLAEGVPHPALDAIVAEAARLFAAPMAAVSILDRERQWFAASIGLAVSGTSRAISFCGHAIAEPEALLVVADAREDARFTGNPLVTGTPAICFYAGAPIVGVDGLPLGALCVIDDRPRDGPQPLDRLRALAARVSAAIARG